ncbi:hypothetical protein G3I76_14965 [Streptomyces sp. SID11233]|nr:hypothetical protein [Streptomyces sp. SID11233]
MRTVKVLSVASAETATWEAVRVPAVLAGLALVRRSLWLVRKDAGRARVGN